MRTIYRISLMLTMVALMAIGVAVSEADNDVKVKSAQVPAVVKTAIEKQLSGGVIKEIERTGNDGNVFYKVEYVKDGRKGEATFSENGRFVKVDKEREYKKKDETKEGHTKKKGFVKNIESIAVKSTAFRRVLYTAEHIQLVVMALKPGEEIGSEEHESDQFFRVEKGTGVAVLAGVRTPISAGYAVLIPGGTTHNIINTGRVPLKLYTLYAPPNHRDGVVHQTRADAVKDDEHFDGVTTE